MLAVDRADGLFARQFAGTVDIQRVGLVGLGIGGAFTTVEHVVGRVVDQRDAKFESLLGEYSRCRGIDGEG
ncbi:hypothetical protein D3C86_2126210 [compost metagenome]